VPRVQITVPPVVNSIGTAATVRVMSSSGMLPRIPQSSSRSAGAAPTAAAVVPASPRTTSMDGGDAARAAADSAGSSSTSRPCTSGPRGWSASTGSTSRPSPAHSDSRRIGPGAARSSATSICRRTSTSRRDSELSGSS
jgi:hypothetical protein